MKYPLFKVHIPDDAHTYLDKVLHSGFINEGVEVKKLTDAMIRWFGTDRLVLANSCTSTLTMALKLAGVGHGDLVISTPMTCVATNCPISNLGAHIHWSDIDRDTGCINPKQVRDIFERCVNTLQPKAVMAVAWAGMPPDLEPLWDVCREYGAKLILDAAQAFGASYKGRLVHEWADYTCYSLQAIKHITSGDGGILITDSRHDVKRARAMKWFGIDREATKDEDGNWKGQAWDFDITEAGFKFNMNNLSAALGLSQIDHMSKILGLHRRNAELYTEAFKNQPLISELKPGYRCRPSHWIYTVTYEGSLVNKEKLLQALNDEEIGASVVHTPNHKYSCFKGAWLLTDLHQTERFSDFQFSLPVGWWLSEDNIKHIARRVIALAEKIESEEA